LNKLYYDVKKKKNKKKQQIPGVFLPIFITGRTYLCAATP